MEAGRFPAAMTTTRWFNHIHLDTPERVCAARVLAARLAWGFVLVVIRIVATSTFLVSVNHAV